MLTKRNFYLIIFTYFIDNLHLVAENIQKELLGDAIDKRQRCSKFRWRKTDAVD